MARSPALRVRRSVRLFAAVGLVMDASLQLGWTPAAPWTPTLALIGAAYDWGPTRPLAGLLSDAVESAFWQLRRGPPW